MLFFYFEKDTRKFLDKGAQIIVGTPGRVEAFMTAMEFSASFKELEVLILDEADRYSFLIFYYLFMFELLFFCVFITSLDIIFIYSYWHMCYQLHEHFTFIIMNNTSLIIFSFFLFSFFIKILFFYFIRYLNTYSKRHFILHVGQSL